VQQLDLETPDPLAALALRRFQASFNDRLNPDRVSASTSTLVAHLTEFGPPPQEKFALSVDWSQFPRDIATAKLFGSHGIPIHVDPGWLPSTEFGSCPAKYRRVHSAINAHVLDDRDKQFCILLPRSLVNSWHLHVQNFGLAAKNGKVQGRLTNNASGVAATTHRRISQLQRHLSFQTSGSTLPCPLNTDYVVNKAIELYGDINHPTLVQIIRTILRAADLYGWDNLVIFTF
jgi:hypothetical protein